MGSLFSNPIKLCDKCNITHSIKGNNGWGFEYCKFCNKCIEKLDTSRVFNAFDNKAIIFKHCQDCNTHHDYYLKLHEPGHFLEYCNECKKCLTSNHIHCKECKLTKLHTHCNKCNKTYYHNHCNKCTLIIHNYHCHKCKKCHTIEINTFYCEECKSCVGEDFRHTKNHNIILN